jgi:hypothetical protein
MTTMLISSIDYRRGLFSSDRCHTTNPSGELQRVWKENGGGVGRCFVGWECAVGKEYLRNEPVLLAEKCPSDGNSASEASTALRTICQGRTS